MGFGLFCFFCCCCWFYRFFVCLGKNNKTNKKGKQTKTKTKNNLQNNHTKQNPPRHMFGVSVTSSLPVASLTRETLPQRDVPVRCPCERRHNLTAPKQVKQPAQLLTRGWIYLQKNKSVYSSKEGWGIWIMEHRRYFSLKIPLSLLPLVLRLWSAFSSCHRLS